MANYENLKTAIQSVIKTNGNEEITGAVMQSSLLSMINSFADGYLFKGVATPLTNAGTPDQNVFYIGGAGTYLNFGTAVTIPEDSVCVFKYNGSWTAEYFTVCVGDDVRILEGKTVPTIDMDFRKSYDERICTIAGLIKNDGTLIPTTAYGDLYKYSDKMPVMVGGEIICNGISADSNYAGLVLYDKNDAPVYICSGVSSCVIDTADYPSTEYFRVSINYYHGLLVDIIYQQTELLKKVVKDDAEITRLIDMDYNQVYDDSICVNYGILKPNGTIYVDEGAYGYNYKYSEKLFVPYGTKYIIIKNSFTLSSSWSGVNLYTEANGLIYAGGGDVIIDVSDYPSMNYFRVCCMINSNFNISFAYEKPELTIQLEKNERYLSLDNRREFPTSILTNEGLIRASGDLFYDTSHSYGGYYKFSDEIEIKEGDVSIYAFATQAKDNSWAGVALYDMGHNPLITFGGTVSIDLSLYPSARYVRFGGLAANYDVHMIVFMEHNEMADSLINIKNKWYGKKWVALGDSWTEGTNVEYNDSYVNVVSKKLGMNVTNLGVGGTGIAVFADNLTQQIANSADLITIWGSINDMAIGGENSGSLNDAPSASGTLVARWKYTIEKVLALAPSKRIVIIGCPIAFHSSWAGYSTYNSNGDTIEKSVMKIEEVSRHYGIPFIDMYHLSGFNSYNFNNRVFDADAVHPNRYGVERVSDILIRQLYTL